MSERLTTQRLESICRAPWQDLDDVTNGEIVAMSDELRERRARDRELHRLADVCHGFCERNGYWPGDATNQIIQMLLGKGGA